MASSPAEMELKITQALKKETGKDYKHWAKVIKKEGPEKYREQIKWLKEEKGLKHGQASIMASIFRNGGDLVYGDPEKLIDEQYKKYPSMRPVFNVLTETFKTQFPNAALHVCKGYLSYVAKTQFATIHPAKNEIKLGLAIREHPIQSDLLLPFKVKDASDKITHYVPIATEKDITKKLIKLIGTVEGYYS